MRRRNMVEGEVHRFNHFLLKASSCSASMSMTRGNSLDLTETPAPEMACHALLVSWHGGAVTSSCANLSRSAIVKGETDARGVLGKDDVLDKLTGASDFERTP